MTTSPRVAVIGAGVTGLAAARHLARAGVNVTVLEASDHVGGQIQTISFDGIDLESGAEALHLAAPGTRALLDDLRLANEIVPAAPLQPWVLTDGELHRLPSGLGPAGPTRVTPLARASGVSLAGRLRAACEPILAAPATADVSVGAFFRARFGGEATAKLVEPLVGTLHHGDIERLSLAATLPMLHDRATTGASLLRGRRRPADSAPGFITLRSGLCRLPEQMADALPDVRLGAHVTTVAPHGDGLQLEFGDGSEPLTCAGVVLTVPAPAGAALLAGWPQAATLLRRIVQTNVAVVTLAFPRSVLGETGGRLVASGLLVGCSDRRLVHAATFTTSKWPHLRTHDHVLMRVSVGEQGTVTDWPGWSDDEIVAGVMRDLATHLGLTDAPIANTVTRWRVPRYEVGHVEIVNALHGALADTAIVVAGSSYRGVGIASCVRQGTDAAAAVVELLARPAEVAR